MAPRNSLVHGIEWKRSPANEWSNDTWKYPLKKTNNAVLRLGLGKYKCDVALKSVVAEPRSRYGRCYPAQPECGRHTLTHIIKLGLSVRDGRVGGQEKAD